MTENDSKALGIYLKDRRTKLDPAAFGFPSSRRRTAGLRREEVAQRANVSSTWYTWLEQGRGGAPSPKVLDRIADALMLNEAEREHIYLIGLGRPPAVRYAPSEGVPNGLQNVINSLEFCPAVVRTATWDVIGWNKALVSVFGDYEHIEPSRRNVLRMMFLSPEWQDHFMDWKKVARAVLALFRAEIVKSGASDAVKALVEELSTLSPEFKEMWGDHDVQLPQEQVKHIKHPIVGVLAMELSSFTVDGRPDLRLIIYTPATPDDAERVKRLVQAHRAELQPV